jgi:hypothetical protein
MGWTAGCSDDVVLMLSCCFVVGFITICRRDRVVNFITEFHSCHIALLRSISESPISIQELT